MPPFGPIKRAKLISYLKQIGWDGPYSGSNHQSMYKNGLKISIPNPHGGDIEKNLLAKILKQAGISKEEWEKL